MTSSRSAIDGAVAGVVSRTVIAPLDVIKIRLQVQNKFYQEYSGIVDCVQKIYRREGVRAFWKGNSSGLLLYGTFGACQFYTFERLNPVVKSTFMSGGLAATVATIATYPFDTIRTQMAIKANNVSPIMMLAHLQKEGLLTGLYKGLLPTIAQVAPYMVSDLISGAAAGVMGKLVTMPFDTTRKRMQIQSQSFRNYQLQNLQRFQSLKHCIAHTWLNEGFRGFYNGLTIALFKSVPGTATTFLVYGLLSKL